MKESRREEVQKPEVEGHGGIQEQVKKIAPLFSLARTLTTLEPLFAMKYKVPSDYEQNCEPGH